MKNCKQCNITKCETCFPKKKLKDGTFAYHSRICKLCKNKNAKQKAIEKAHVIIAIEGEFWVPIDKFEGYMVSNKGRIKSLSKINRPYERIINPTKQNTGYYSAALYILDNGDFKRVSVHRIVAQAFIENPLTKPCVNHKDHNRGNNSIGNLEWCTHKENSEHAKAHKRFQLGQERYNNVVSDKDVMDIFNSDLPQRVLSKKYKIHQGTIAKIKTGQNWGHLTGKQYVKNFNKFGKCNQSVS